MATLLVVEENVTLGQLYVNLFTELGMRVARTTNCLQTLTYLAKPHIPNLVLLDLGLVDGSGISIVRYLRSEPGLFAQTQMVVIIDGEDTSLMENILRHEHVFCKPVTLPTLTRFVKQLIAEVE